ncbi:MAG: CHASE3 domain-containing protein [Parvibaculaceae bacterium]
MDGERRTTLSAHLFTIVAGFAVLFLVLGATAWLVERQRDNNESVRHTLGVEASLSRVLSLIQDAETGQRGYLLTGEESYLEPYTEAIAPLRPELDALGKEIADNPDQVRALNMLRDVAEQRLALLAEGIARMRAGEADVGRVIIRSGKGKEAMTRIRDIVSRMRAEEDRLLGERLARADRTARALQVVSLTAIAAVLLLAFSAIASIRRSMRELVAARDETTTAYNSLLKETTAREAAEQQNRQMQKMEAIGHLTAGVAHDFNNMLAVVISGLNLVQKRLAKGDMDVGRFIEGALEGAHRAATLTTRLLAFSRQQALMPAVLDVNRLVTDMSDLLRRTLGEQFSLETVLAGGLWKSHADAGQLENAILNLCVNARDAMPEGGKLTIETGNAYLDEAYASIHAEVQAGQYVLVAVSDTGHGMSGDVLARAFDPFFTTKGTGKGTGLGLSQVYGFVKQSGGHVKIYSEVGQGTAVKMYFPRYLGAEDMPAPTPPAQPAAANRGEIVLVVEDEDRVRQLTVASLRELGYTVLHAASGPQALELLGKHPDIGLLFTDVVMPEMNGRKLSERALKERPALKVLYTTGYTRNAVVHHGVVDADAKLLMKPFTLEQLAAKMREVLDG